MAILAVPVLKVTGWRFSKDFRQSDSGWKKWVYWCTDTVMANIWAD
jgi:hypothetical protein